MTCLMYVEWFLGSQVSCTIFLQGCSQVSPHIMEESPNFNISHPFFHIKINSSSPCLNSAINGWKKIGFQSRQPYVLGLALLFSICLTLSKSSLESSILKRRLDDIGSKMIDVIVIIIHNKKVMNNT